MSFVRLLACLLRGHEWIRAGYVLSYLPGGRDWREVCERCGHERRWHPEVGYH